MKLTKASERYLQDRKNTKWLAENHFKRAKDLESRSDAENRLYLLNGEFDSFSYFRDLSPLYRDPVYKMVVDAKKEIKSIFDQLKKEKPMEYKNNSRQNQKIRKHKRYFETYLVKEVLHKMEDRSMSEKEYLALSENGLMHAYERSKDLMDYIEERDDKIEIAYYQLLHTIFERKIGNWK